MSHFDSRARTDALPLSTSVPSTRAGFTGRRSIAMVALVVPLFVQVLLLRLLEFTMVSRGQIVPIGPLLWANAPLPALNLIVGVIAFWLALGGRTGTLPTLLAATVATLTTAAGLVVSALFGPWWLTEWLSAEALETIRHDAVLLLVAAALVGASQTVRLPRIRATLTVTTHVAIPFLMTVSLGSFAFFLATGSTADWIIVEYAFQNLSDIKDLLLASTAIGALLLMAFPWLLSLAIAIYVRRECDTDNRTQAVRHTLPAALIPPLVLLIAFPSSPLPDVFRSGSLTGLASAALTGLTGEVSAAPDAAASVSTNNDATGIAVVTGGAFEARNVVLVILESVRSRSVTPYDPSLQTMPFLDSLARRGAIVDEMYAVVSYTNKALVPMLAGVYPRPGRQITEAFSGALPGKGLPHLLGSVGYRSAFFTPATLEYERKDSLLANLGFETLYGAEDIPADSHPTKEYFGYHDTAALKPAMEWVDETVDKQRPFLLTYLTLTGHHPYDTPEGFRWNKVPPAAPELASYYRALRYTDEFLRSLILEFDARSLTDNTIFIVIGDHGEAFGEHMEKTHGNVIWDEALHVPCVIWAPGQVQAGERIEGLRHQLDLVPTVIALLGLELSGGTLPGVSLFEPVSRRRTIYHQSLDDQRSMALRRDSLKFLYFYRRRPSRIYLVDRDPLETIDRAHEYSEASIAEMEMELLLWKRMVEASYAR